MTGSQGTGQAARLYAFECAFVLDVAELERASAHASRMATIMGHCRLNKPQQLTQKRRRTM
jgi:hypothetical protein